MEKFLGSDGRKTIQDTCKNKHLSEIEFTSTLHILSCYLNHYYTIFMLLTHGKVSLKEFMSIIQKILAKLYVSIIIEFCSVFLILISQ